MARYTLGKMKLVTGFWRAHPRRFILFILLAMANTTLAIVYPRILGFAVDGIQAALANPASFRVAQLLGLVGLLFVVGVLYAFVAEGQPVAWYRTSLLFAWHNRVAVFRKILGRGFGFANRFPSGDVLQRLDADLTDVSFFSSTGIFWPLSSILTLVVALLVLLRMNVLLTVMAVLPVSLMALVWSRIGPLIDRWWRDWREQMSATNNFLEASYSGIRLVKSYAMEERNTARFRKVLDARVKAAVRGATVQAVSETSFNAISGLGLLFVLAFGGGLVIRGQLSLGQFVAFNAYVTMLIGPMMAIGDMFVWIKTAGVEEERVRELADFPPDVEQGHDRNPPGIPDRVPGIALDNVSFRYPAAEGKGVDVLAGISLSVKPGERVGIAGTVGSGKSTVMRLLLRLAEPTAGEVTVVGRSAREYDIVSLRRMYGYAPQEPGLFSDTIAENIALGRDGGDVQQAARLAQLDSDIAQMPKGLEERIGERGTKLSGGQRGRVAIARALYGRPKVLLLDDVTASLDAETEQSFVARVLDEMRGASVIIVSHRLAILAACDRVYVLDGGRIVEQGTHHQLLDRRGTYWQLYERQLARQQLGPS